MTTIKIDRLDCNTMHQLTDKEIAATMGGITLSEALGAIGQIGALINPPDTVVVAPPPSGLDKALLTLQSLNAQNAAINQAGLATALALTGA